MSKLKVRNFGPIKQGMSNDEWIDFSQVTVFIGNQGTGKSTIVKLYAAFGWLEKKLIRNYTTIDEILNESNPDYSLTKRLEYFNLTSYLDDDSYIEYKSSYYHFVIENKKFKAITELSPSHFAITTKIAYIPAERNFITAIESSMRMTQLPPPLSRFQAEYFNGLEELTEKESLQLDIDDLSIKYENQLTKIINNKKQFTIKMHEASSGIQSLAPILIHSQYNSQHILHNISNASKINLEYFQNDAYNYSVEAENVFKKLLGEKLLPERKKFEDTQAKLSLINVTYIPKRVSENPEFQDTIQKIISLIGISDTFKEPYNNIDDLKQIFSEINNKNTNDYKKIAERVERFEIFKFFDFTLTNIIEELEQNLFPESLKKILYKLLAQINEIHANYDNESDEYDRFKYEIGKLILTTHSPYMISYLTLIAKAGNTLKEIKETNMNVEEVGLAKQKINSIIPINALITGDKMKIYHLDDGGISLLENYKDMPSDENYLNLEIKKINTDYKKLMQIRSSYYIEPDQTEMEEML